MTAFVTRRYGLPSSTFTIAVCGIRVLSEHEDECCVLMQLHTIPSIFGSVGSLFNTSGQNSILDENLLRDTVRDKLMTSFIEDACAKESGVSKGSKVFSTSCIQCCFTIIIFVNSQIGLLLVIFQWLRPRELWMCPTWSSIGRL